MRMSTIKGTLSFLLPLFALTAWNIQPTARPVSAQSQEALAHPPTQPASGFGGAEYRYANVRAGYYGSTPSGFWLFEPVGASMDQSPPLVIFLHGFGTVDPAIYRAWIDHIVRRGAVVLYPEYQSPGFFAGEPDAFLGRTQEAVRKGLEVLRSGTHIAPNTDDVVVVGHSVGAVLAANYSATAKQHGLPMPFAMMLVQAGGCRGCGKAEIIIDVPIEDLSTIDDSTRTLVVVGSDDSVVGDSGSLLVWNQLGNISPDRRRYVIIRSDDHGDPTLTAEHTQPWSDSEGLYVDALDWFGTWKLFDALVGCYVESTECSTVFGEPREQRYMGQWSNGTPVVELIVKNAP